MKGNRSDYPVFGAQAINVDANIAVKDLTIPYPAGKIQNHAATMQSLLFPGLPDGPTHRAGYTVHPFFMKQG